MNRQRSRRRSLVSGSGSRHVELAGRHAFAACAPKTALTSDGPQPHDEATPHLIVVGRRWVFAWRAQAAAETLDSERAPCAANPHPFDTRSR